MTKSVRAISTYLVGLLFILANAKTANVFADAANHEEFDPKWRSPARISESQEGRSRVVSCVSQTTREAHLRILLMWRA